MPILKKRPQSKASLLIFVASILLACFQVYAKNTQEVASSRVGVIYVVHGAPRRQGFSHIFDAAIQIASYDPNSHIFKDVIWNPENWPQIIPLADKKQSSGVLALYHKYVFEIGRLGGIDPATRITEAQVESLQNELIRMKKPGGPSYLVDWAGWIAGSTDIEHLPYPRFIYDQGGRADKKMRHCGGPSDGGAPPDHSWADCDPERYNVDGPIERLIQANVDMIVVIDTTVGGVRFSKSFDVYRKLLLARDSALAGTDRSLPIVWANDPTGLMAESYPTSPAGWTATVGRPEIDPIVELNLRGNPVSDASVYADIVADGIRRAMSPDIPKSQTGVLLFNHGIYPGNEFFDPKINDTLKLNQNLQASLLESFPSMPAENIVGGWEGVKEQSNGLLQRTRGMRGENLGHAFLYEKDEEMPPGKWGLRYWEALQKLKRQGVKHIVIAFPQVIVSSIPSLVEFPNQVAKEIGYRGFRPIEPTVKLRWPGFDNPFANYWPPEAERLCPIAKEAGIQECCYKLGGCSERNSYPPLRQTSVERPLSRTDPSLVFDVPAFGHLGYNEKLGPPSNDFPVHEQYDGTWSIWVPLDNHQRLAKHLAQVVAETVETN